MRFRIWADKALWFVFGAVAVGVLIFMSTAYGKRIESSLRVQPGQEIVLDDNLKIVVGRIEGGRAEMFIYRNSEAAQPIPTPRDKEDKREKPDKSDPCAGSDKEESNKVPFWDKH